MYNQGNNQYNNGGGYNNQPNQPNQQNGQQRRFVKKPPKAEGWYILHIKEAWMKFFGQFNKLQVKFYVVNAPDNDPQKMHKQMTLTFNSNVVAGSVEDKLFKFAGGINLMPNQQPDVQVLINKYVCVYVGVQQAKTTGNLYNFAGDIAALPQNFQLPQGYNPNYVYQRQNYQNNGQQQQYRQQQPPQANPYAQQPNNQKGSNQYNNQNVGQQYNTGYTQPVNQNQRPPHANPYAPQGNPPTQNPYGRQSNQPPQNNPYVQDDVNDAIVDEEMPF